MSSAYSPIDCSDYDYIEIVCMFNYRVEVVLRSTSITGTALNTQKNAEGEFLLLELEDKSRDLIRVDKIVKLVVLDKNAKFSEHEFNHTPTS